MFKTCKVLNPWSINYKTDQTQHLRNYYLVYLYNKLISHSTNSNNG